MLRARCFTTSALRLAAPKARAPSANSSPARSEAALLDLYAQAVEPRAPPPPPAPSPAALQEWKAMSSLYVKLMWRRQHVLQRDWNRKARLKWAALHALPSEEHRRDALHVDPHVPLELYLPLQTPPLAGFHGPEDAARERARLEALRVARARDGRGREAHVGAKGGGGGRGRRLWRAAGRQQESLAPAGLL